MNTKIKSIRIIIAAISLASLIPASLQGSTVTVSSTEAGCYTGILNSIPGTVCGGTSTYTKAERTTTASITDPGNPIPVIKGNDTLDNCGNSSPQTYNTPSYTYTESNTLTYNTGGSLTGTLKGAVEVEISTSAGTTNGQSVSVTVPTQSIAVKAHAKKLYNVLESKNQGMQITGTGFYTCYYQITTLAAPCSGHAVGDTVSVSSPTGSETASATVFSGSGSLSVSDGSCTCTP